MDSQLYTLADITDYFDRRDFSVCAFDTETNSLIYRKLQMEGCSFANGESACYINLHNNPQRLGIIAFLHHLFRNKIRSLIMHNAPFDLKVLYKEGIWDVTPKVFCTMTAHHLINENSQHGLKFLAAKYLGVTPVSYLEASTCGLDHPMFLEYALNDAKWTWELHKIFNKKIYELDMQRLFFEVEMPFQFCLMDMEINGVLVNEKKLEDLRIKATQTHFDLLIQLYKLANIGYSIQPDMFTGECEIVSKKGMTDAVCRGIMEKRGLKSPYLTKGGADGLNKLVSVGTETLTHLAGDEFIDVLTKYKIVDHLLGSFIHKMPGHIEDDGRVRSTYWNTGAKTGRLSSRDPNMQQNPKERVQLPFDFKQIFEAPEGKKLLSVDYSGQELRILAIVSQDPTLLHAFKNRFDLHLMTANYVGGLGLEGEQLIEDTIEHGKAKKKYEHERDIAKNCYNFPIIYGTTAYGISKNAGITEKEAQAGIDKFFTAYPGVRTAINRTSQFLTENWHVQSLTRRRRRLDPGEKKSHRQAFNFLIQGLAADMIRCACNNLRLIIKEHPEWGIKMIMIIHDEIVMEINEEWIEKATPIIKDIMENAMPKLPIKMEVEIGIGSNYSGAK